MNESTEYEKKAETNNKQMKERERKKKNISKIDFNAEAG